MLRVGFEPTIPVFERAKIAHALDRAANVIGSHPRYISEIEKNKTKLRDFSPQANYTDRATAACRRS
jgi:hypothetical protein